MYVTNQEQIVEAAKVAYAKYPTIVNNIPLEGASTYKNNPESYALMDSKISSAQMAIGYSSNLAQMALSYYYDKYYWRNVKSPELEDIFVICSVLAQCAIDSAKRIYSVNIKAELNKIRDMECMREYCKKVNEENEEGEEEVRRVPKVPLFYKENQESRGNKEGNYVVDTTIRCPMQILYEIIDLGVERQDPKVTTKFSDVFEYAYNSKIKKNYGKQLERVEKLISKYNLQIKSVDPKLEDCFEKKCMIFNDYMKKMLKWKIKQETMNYLVDYAFKNTDVCDNMLIMLYKYDSGMFLKCFKINKKDQKCPQNS